MDYRNKVLPNVLYELNRQYAHFLINKSMGKIYMYDPGMCYVHVKLCLYIIVLFRQREYLTDSFLDISSGQEMVLSVSGRGAQEKMEEVAVTF